MDVLVPDTTSPTARQAARALAEAGHTVHTCVSDDGALCEALVGHTCPLDASPIDVVLDAREDGLARFMGDGALCAVRRHLPLVTTGGGEQPFAPWASADAPAETVAITVEEVLNQPLSGQTAAAAKTLLHELRHHGMPSSAASVSVYRRPGRLLIELHTDTSVSRTLAERLATHVAQGVRAYDRWAPKMDVTVRSAEVLAAT